MAIRQRGNTFQVYWRNPFTGKRESITQPTLEEAKKYDALIKYRLEYERDSFRRPGEALKKEPAPAPAHGHALTLENAYFQYLREKHFDKKSLQWQVYAMRPALEMLGQMTLDEITFRHLQQVKAVYLAAGTRDVTTHNRLAVLRTVLRWCVKNELMETMPRFPELPPEEYEKFVPLNAEEFRQVYAEASDRLQRVMVLGAQFGLRVGPSEAFKLKWSDVDIFRRVIRVQAARKNPREPWREVPIRQDLLPQIIEWMKADRGVSEYVVHNKQGGQVKSIRKEWADTLKRAGITRRVRPYDLRHGFATEMLAAGVDPGTVATLMGHTATDMIFQHYQHVMTQQKVRAMESLPPIALCAKPDVPSSCVTILMSGNSLK